MNTKLWQPIQVGDIKLDHRLAMAPMTRGRSTTQGVPTDLNAEYYARRASMALIISEGTQPSDDGQAICSRQESTPMIRSSAGVK
jgi:N-ethylmaleimide reductase